MVIKQNSSSLPRKLVLGTFSKLLIVFSMKKSAIPPLLAAWRCCKAKLFAKSLSKNSNLDDSGIYLPVLPSRTKLKLHNISVTPKMIKRIIHNKPCFIKGVKKLIYKFLIGSYKILLRFLRKNLISFL